LALPVAGVRDEVPAIGGPPLGRSLLEPGHVVPDELAAVLVIAHEPLKPAHVLVQPDRVEVVAA